MLLMETLFSLRTIFPCLSLHIDIVSHHMASYRFIWYRIASYSIVSHCIASYCITVVLKVSHIGLHARHITWYNNNIARYRNVHSLRRELTPIACCFYRIRASCGFARGLVLSLQQVELPFISPAIPYLRLVLCYIGCWILILLSSIVFCVGRISSVCFKCN